MKKIIIVVLILILAMLCLTSCEQSIDYSQLNQMATKTYSQITMDITVQKGDDVKLQSKIICISEDETSREIAFNIQEFATIDVDGDTITLPSQQIVTKSGNITFANGQVSVWDGDKVNYDFSNIGNKLGMLFSEHTLANAKVEDGMFKADVVNAFLFFGRDIAGAKSICVKVDIETYKCITVAYVASNGSNVKIVYTLG